MSTYGILTQRADGSVMMNGLTRGGVFIEILSIAGGTSGTKSYPGTGGSSLYFYTSSAARHTVSVGTDTNGAGCINWTATDTNSNVSTVIYVFASKLVTSDTYGIKVVNDQGEVLADQGYPNPQYIAKVTLNATATATYSTPDGYTAYVHDSPAATYQDSSDKFVLVAMPDSGTNDTWYSLFNECIPAGRGPISLRVTVYSKTSAYTIPSLHVYAINHPSPSASIYGIQLHDASGALTYDSSMESVSTSDVLTINYPTAGSTNTYSLAVTSMPGISIPFYYQADYSGSISTRYAGVAKKVGAQLTFGLIKDAQSSNAPVLAAYKLGSQTGRYCPVVDLSQLGPANPTGTPGGATWTTPSFTTQPAAFPRCKPGDTLSLTVAVSGNPTPTVQWYKNGAAIAGATSTTYSKIADSSDDQAQFYCVASNILMDVQSNTSKATVNNNTVPAITGKTGDQTVSVGTSVTISFTASGVPAPTYSIAGPGNLSSNTNSLTFTPSSVGSYVFTCTATNSEGYASANITITVSQPPVISTQPQSQSVTVGGTASFSVQTSGDVENPAFQWYRNGTAVSGATSPSYSFATSISNNGDTFYCVVTNSRGSTQSNTATLTVTQAPTAPSFVSGPTATNCDQGGTTSLACSVNGYPAPTVTWKQGSTVLGTGSSLVATPIGTGNQVITCTLSNASGTVSSSVTIFIWATFSVAISPSSAANASGTGQTFTATVSGSNYSLLFHWTGPNNFSQTVAGSSPSSITVTTGSSTIGTYTCTVTYSLATNPNTNNGTTTQSQSASCSLSMNPPPTISQQPSSVSVYQGQSASFSVTASPVTSYQWYRNGSAISGATGSSVSADTSAVGSFSYFCIVSNGPAATQSSTATLTVSSPPAATYPSYNGIGGTDSEYSTTAEFDIFGDGHYDLHSGGVGYWANGSGDGSLYDVMASASGAALASGSYGLNTWYSLASGVGWLIAPSGATGHISNTTLSITVRLRATGATVSSGSVTLTTQNGGTQA